jgi:DNA polymerase zeta
VTILRSGIIMKTRFRIYESHLSFPLQFMCDFGLYGCGSLELNGGWERCMDDTAETQTSLFKRSPHFRQSRLPLELDVIAPQVWNRHNLNPRNMAFNIGEPPPVLQEERFVLSVRELWEDESKRRQARGLNPTPELPLDPSASSRGPGGEWVAEARYWEAIRKRIASEPKIQLSSTPEQWECRVMSTFESIEAIWAEEFQTWKPSAPQPGSEAAQEAVSERELPYNDLEEPLGGVEVDLELLSAEDLDAQDMHNQQGAVPDEREEIFGSQEDDEGVVDDELALYEDQDEEEEEELEEIVKEQR